MVEFRVGQAFEMYRVAMPIALGTEQAHAGTWTALIGVSGKFGGEFTHALAAARGSARYSLNVQALSNLRMRATLAQSGNEPGAVIYLSVALTEYAIPLAAPARVRAELVRPDGVRTVVPLVAAGPGAYEASVAATQPGVWRFRIIAEGSTMRGRRFTREQTLTGAVWPGGDRPPRDPSDPSRRFCRLLHCLLSQKRIMEWLHQQGIDPDHLARCLSEVCRREREELDPAGLQAILQDKGVAALLTEALRRMDRPLG
jgi:hypothetical protein